MRTVRLPTRLGLFVCLNLVLAVEGRSNVYDKDKLTGREALALVRVIDERQKNSGDYQSVAYVKETSRDKDPKVYQVVVYRRDEDDKFLIMFNKPKAEAGKGYLRIDKNFWLYDPNTGKWERRTERERIGGTNSRRGDFDDPNLAVEYDVTYEGSGSLGKFKTHKLKLVAKKGVDVAYPILKLAIDRANLNVLKRQEFALSGKLMRSTYYPKWTKKFSQSKKDEVWIPAEMRIFDELIKENTTVILIKKTDLAPLAKNIFTKAWVESKSR